MKRRHPRLASSRCGEAASGAQRTALAVLAAVALLSSPLAVSATPAEAATTAQIAGTGTVRTGGTPLNMRKTPSSSSARVGTVATGGKVWIMCQVAAEQVSGTVRTTRMWNRLANNAYVSDGYVVRTGFTIPSCSGATPSTPSTPAAGAWTLPVGAGLVSGFRTTARPTHDGVDLAAARDTPIRAASSGTVIRVVCNVSAGSCDSDGNRTLRGCGWYAEIQHAANVVTRYCHMVRRPSVTVGQVVATGQVIGYVGTSGSSSGPHLHFEVHTHAPPATHDNAVNPAWFLRARGVTLG